MSDFKVSEVVERPFGETQEFIRSLGVTQDPVAEGAFFNKTQAVVVTRAPGRLDVMGGIADYSGSLVLQLPIANATHVALQKADSKKLRLLSLGTSSSTRYIELDLSEFLTNANEPIDYVNASRRFQSPADEWATHVAGAFLVLMREKGIQFDAGASILIKSDVPEGKGVSSSAAVEIAVMQAVNVAFEVGVEPQELARLCQMVENFIAGAPSGIMDQMTSACGEENRLLELLCQPGVLKGTLALPVELELWGVDSGVRHAVSGSDYGTVRTAAFMGYRIIADIAGLEALPSNIPGKVQIADSKWHGYLANITPAEFEERFARLLPDSLNGEVFLERYRGTTDEVTRVNPRIDYPVRAATKHPIYEHARVQSFAATLKNWNGVEQAPSLGELMLESHQSYSDCGLGSDATDLIVKLVRECSRDGLFGARITGGGSGGTVAVLGRSDANAAIEKVKQRFHKETGHDPLIISGSSPGAAAFNHLSLENLMSTNL